MDLKDLNQRRNKFGAMILPQGSEIHKAVESMLFSAVKKGLLPSTYDNLSWDKKSRVEGTAVHHDIYDLSLRKRGNGTTLRKCLVCIRYAKGNGKYGVSTVSKRYLVVKFGRGRAMDVAEAPKHMVCKIAKTQARLGHTIAYVEHFNTKVEERMKDQQLEALYDNTAEIRSSLC